MTTSPRPFALFGLLSLGGCPASSPTAVPSEESDTDTDTDADTGKDEDTDTDTDTDVDLGPGFGNSDIPLTDGYVIVALAQRPQGNEAYVTAQFWETTSPPSGAPLLPEAADTCASITYTLADLEGDDWERTIQSAGSVQFQGPVNVPALSPQGSLGGGYYGTIAASPFPYGSTWSVSAAGSAFPAFSLPGVIQVPANLFVQSPSQGFVLDGPLELRWSGGDASVSVTIRVSTTDAVNGLYGRIVCETWNDGSFTVPEDIVEAMPSGVATVQIEHLRRSLVTVGGRSLRAEGVISVLRVGSRP